MKRGVRVTTLFLALLALTGCPKAEPEGGGTGAEGGVPSASDWTEGNTQEVREACSRCHTAPPPDSLPKERWATIVPQMASMPGTGKPSSKEEVALATAYYTRNAPEALPKAAPSPKVDPGPVSFRTEQIMPPDKKLAELRMPSVANVAWVNLSDGSRKDLLISDMRTSTLMILSPWREGAQRRIRRLGKGLGYPVHAVLQDANGDGRQDVLVASHGAMNPTNETRGGVTLMLQSPKRRFLNLQVATGLGRPADVRGADLDGDKDMDLVVAAFGWRGPGKLLLLEHKGPAAAIKPTYQPKELDDRDGFIHVEPTDLNGDGRLDLVAILSQEHEQVLAFVNRGGMKLEKKVLHRAPHPSWGFSGLQLVDMDGDGDTDLLVSNGDALDDDLLKPYHGVSWLENQGDLKFAEHRVGALYGCERAVAADLDGDGDQDVVAVAFLPQLGPEVWKREQLDSVVWFERDGEAWKRHALEKSKCYHPTVDVADYDDDGKQDIAIGNFVWLEQDASDPSAGGKPNVQADYLTLMTQQ